MAEKPSELDYKYEAWRGTPEHLVEIAAVVRDEIARASKTAKDVALAEIRRNSDESKVTAESHLRERDGLAPDAPLTPEQQTELNQFNAAVDTYDERQKKSGEEVIERGTRLKFGYRDKAGRFKSDQKPEFLKNTPTSAVGVEMIGSTIAPPSAFITVRIQNQPWEAVTINVHGDDPDWVSSSLMPLDSAISARQPRYVVFLRNQWFRSLIGISIWLLLIAPTANLFERLGADRLLSLPVSLVMAGAITLPLQNWSRPFLLSGRSPSTLLEIGKAIIPYLVGALLRFVLDLIAARVERGLS